MRNQEVLALNDVSPTGAGVAKQALDAHRLIRNPNPAPAPRHPTPPLPQRMRARSRHAQIKLKQLIQIIKFMRSSAVCGRLSRDKKFIESKEQAF
jgi:hypothetical protein